MTQSSIVLKQILSESSKRLSGGEKVLLVFDLDSTLFDVGPRIQRILRDFSELAEIKALDPVNAELLGSIKTQRKDWGIRGAIERAGIHTVNPELAGRARKFWVQHFFSNEYLQHDLPLAGAVRFVQVLHQMGAGVIYLTGRDITKMHPGSLSSLRAHSFPLSDDGIELVMKPQSGLEDFAFKEKWFDELTKNPYAKIWFFENEPVNLDRIRLKHPEVELIFVDSTHSQRMPSPTDLLTIDDFAVDWETVRPHLAPEHRMLLEKF